MAKNKNIETVVVKSGLGNNRVALWERDDAHPNAEHEIFLAGDTVMEAALTPAVQQHLGRGELVEVSGKEARAAKRAAKEDAEAEAEDEDSAKPTKATKTDKAAEPVAPRPAVQTNPAPSVEVSGKDVGRAFSAVQETNVPKPATGDTNAPKSALTHESVEDAAKARKARGNT